MVRAELGDEQFRILRRIQNGHGKANIVIVVPRALEELKISSQNARDHFLRRCLADAAGNADDLEGKHLAVVPRNLAIGAQCVFDHDARKLPAFLTHERRDSALFFGGRDVFMSVDPLAAKRQKELSGLHLAGVRLNAVYLDCFILRRDLAAAPACQLL